MALIVVMPAIARVMPMMGPMPGMDGYCPHHVAAGAKQPDPPPAPADPMERCGYCFLLNHSPLLSSGAIVHRVPAAPPLGAPVAALPTDRVHTLILSADPRGPPRADIS